METSYTRPDLVIAGQSVPKTVHCEADRVHNIVYCAFIYTVGNRLEDVLISRSGFTYLKPSAILRDHDILRANHERFICIVKCTTLKFPSLISQAFPHELLTFPPESLRIFSPHLRCVNIRRTFIIRRAEHAYD